MHVISLGEDAANLHQVFLLSYYMVHKPAHYQPLHKHNGNSTKTMDEGRQDWTSHEHNDNSVKTTDEERQSSMVFALFPLCL